MNLLFIHQNFPGQFRHLAQHLARDPQHRVVAIGKAGCPGLPGIKTLTYKLHRDPARQTHHYARSYEAGILHGQAVIRLLLQLKEQGFTPDAIVAHPGWGETLFVKEVFPQARLIHFCEYYYHPQGADAGFDPEFPLTIDDRARIRARNALHLLNLEQCDIAVTPTQWQKSLHPRAYQDKIQVIHEGIDTDTMRPDPKATFQLPNGKQLKAGDPVVTYVARNLEPYRGFHTFMRAVPQILDQHKTCDIVIVGGDDVSYGSKPKDAKHWREKMLREVEIDPNRVHFLGKIPYERYRSLLQVSAAHVYLTYPFVLSWSMLEAMACGCLVIGSDTAPVREVLEHGVSGVVVDFFNIAQITKSVSAALFQREAGLSARHMARQITTDRYSLSSGTHRYLKLFGEGQ